MQGAEATSRPCFAASLAVRRALCGRVLRRFSPEPYGMALASSERMHPVDSLGEPRFDSPLDPSSASFVSTSSGDFERAGPRARVHFEPKAARAAIVTCGGLSPATNNVIRALFLTLFHRYGVRA